LLGIGVALAVGIIAGLIQAAIMIRLRLGSVGVTLGGLLTFVGIAHVLTENRAVGYSNMEVALAVNDRIAGVLSLRSLLAFAVFILAAAVIGYTRIGRDLIAMGSDRRAAVVAGVNEPALLLGSFAFSGAMAALAGALIAYSLASASPSGVTDVLVPAAAAAILGGVSLSGGTGRPLGIGAGVLVLALLRAGLNAIEAPPHVHDIAMGLILLAVAVMGGPALGRRIREIAQRLGRRGAV
jgi:ribose/xylose/arabinose/galactoside ABC-type transport system permease subunit